MLKRCYSLIVFVFLFCGCALHAQAATKTNIKATGGRITQNRPVGSFNQVDIAGQVNVNLHTGYKKPQVILTGDVRDLSQVTVEVDQNTVHIKVANGSPHYGAITADIKGHFLNRLHFVGSGNITGNSLHTSLLDLDIENSGNTRLAGSIGLHLLNIVGTGLTQINGISAQNLQIHLEGNPKVQLTGVANISSLDIDGDGWLGLYWVKSNNLSIRAKQGAKIQLAGIANRLEVELWDHANFKGRYLRAQRTFVKTHDKSSAEISSVKHQSNLARDASDIYYYNIPDTRADFMANNGSVLDMREWNQNDFEEFTRYNKQFP